MQEYFFPIVSSIIHLSIHYLYLLYIQGHVEVEANPSRLHTWGGIRSGQVTFTPMDNFKKPIDFGMWEEENSCRQRENMQNLNTRAQSATRFKPRTFQQRHINDKSNIKQRSHWCKCWPAVQLSRGSAQIVGDLCDDCNGVDGDISCLDGVYRWGSERPGQNKELKNCCISLSSGRSHNTTIYRYLNRIMGNVENPNVKKKTIITKHSIPPFAPLKIMLWYKFCHSGWIFHLSYINHHKKINLIASHINRSSPPSAKNYYVKNNNCEIMNI